MMLDEAWEKAERRFLKRVQKIVPEDLLQDAIDVDDPKLRAEVYRRAFKGANSKGKKGGGWAWQPLVTVARKLSSSESTTALLSDRQFSGGYSSYARCAPIRPSRPSNRSSYEARPT